MCGESWHLPPLFEGPTKREESVSPSCALSQVPCDPQIRFVGRMTHSSAMSSSQTEKTCGSVESPCTRSQPIHNGRVRPTAGDRRGATNRTSIGKFKNEQSQREFASPATTLAGGRGAAGGLRRRDGHCRRNRQRRRGCCCCCAWDGGCPRAKTQYMDQLRQRGRHLYRTWHAQRSIWRKRGVLLQNGDGFHRLQQRGLGRSGAGCVEAL